MKFKSLPRQRIFVAGVAVGAIGLAGVLGVSAFSFGEPAPSAPAKMSLMTRPTQADDRLPAGFEKLPIAERVSDVAAARLARSVDGQNYYVVPGKASSICLIRTSGAGDALETAGTCGALSEMNSTGVYLASGTPDSVTIAVLVPDGYEMATAPGRQASVINNLALLPQGAPGTVVLRGSKFADQKIELGNLAAPPRPDSSQAVS